MNLLQNKRVLLPLVLGGTLFVGLPVVLGGALLVAVLAGGSDDLAPSGAGAGQASQYGVGFDAYQQGYAQLGYAQQSAAAAALLQGLGGSAQGGAVDNFWYGGGAMGNHDADNSAGYVHIPSSTGGSGTTVSYGY